MLCSLPPEVVLHILKQLALLHRQHPLYHYMHDLCALRLSCRYLNSVIINNTTLKVLLSPLCHFYLKHDQYDTPLSSTRLGSRYDIHFSCQFTSLPIFTRFALLFKKPFLYPNSDWQDPKQDLVCYKKVKSQAVFRSLGRLTACADNSQASLHYSPLLDKLFWTDPAATCYQAVVVEDIIEAPVDTTYHLFVHSRSGRPLHFSDASFICEHDRFGIRGFCQDPLPKLVTYLDLTSDLSLSQADVLLLFNWYRDEIFGKNVRFVMRYHEQWFCSGVNVVICSSFQPLSMASMDEIRQQESALVAERNRAWKQKQLTQVSQLCLGAKAAIDKANTVNKRRQLQRGIRHFKACLNKLCG